MSSNERLQSPKLLRFATYLFPPAGLVLLWLNRGLSVRRKILGTAFIAFYSLVIVYGVLVLAALQLGHGFGLVEWRGGLLPTLTLRKTLPDYDRLEQDRARHAQGAAPAVADGTAPYWTGLRGPNGDGHYTEQPIRTDWAARGLRELWRQPVGGGYASFAIAHGRAFTIEQRRHLEVVAAYDVETGRELWTHTWEAEFREPMGGDGPRATPTYDDGCVYAVGARGEFRCLDAASGSVLWRRDIVAENGADVLTYGISFSPLIVGDKVITLPGGEGGRSVVAYDKKTGEVIWRALDDRQSYVSPMFVTLAGEPQLLVVSSSRAMGLSPEDGQLLWEFPWRVQQGNMIAQPLILGADRFLISAAYGTGCAAVRVTREGSQFSTGELWRNRFLKNKFSSSVLWEGHVYGLDESILTCLDAETGERKWKDGRYGYGQLLLAGGHLVILCGNGDLALVKATSTRHEEMARVPGIKGKTWNNPALADGKLFVRNSVEMACFDVAVTP